MTKREDAGECKRGEKGVQAKEPKREVKRGRQRTAWLDSKVKSRIEASGAWEGEGREDTKGIAEDSKLQLGRRN